MTTETMSADEAAERIAETLNGAGYIARVWDKGSAPRVYVSRRLSRGNQDMGFVECLADHRNYNGMTRQRAGVRDLVEAALSSVVV